MNRTYCIALACGVIPLVIGVATFVFWLATGEDDLMVVGAVVVYGGLAMVAVGAVALVWPTRRASREPGVAEARSWLATVACVLVMAANLPVAMGILHQVVSMETAFTVVVRNDSGEPVESVRVFGGGCDERWDLIPPGEWRSATIWIQSDGVLEFRARGGGADYDVIVQAYVTRGQGGHQTVTMHPDHTVSVVGEGS